MGTGHNLLRWTMSIDWQYRQSVATRVVNQKPKVVFSVVFCQPKPTFFFVSVFRLPKADRKRESTVLFFRTVFYPCPLRRYRLHMCVEKTETGRHLPRQFRQKNENPTEPFSFSANNTACGCWLLYNFVRLYFLAQQPQVRHEGHVTPYDHVVTWYQDIHTEPPFELLAIWLVSPGNRPRNRRRSVQFGFGFVYFFLTDWNRRAFRQNNEKPSSWASLKRVYTSDWPCPHQLCEFGLEFWTRFSSCINRRFDFWPSFFFRDMAGPMEKI